MCRKLATIAVVGGLTVGFGCHHIGGKADCGYNPADYPIHGPTQPYPSFTPLVPVPPPSSTPADKTPESKGTKDADKTKN